MKLQPIQSVASQVTAQKKAQIDEGVQLAKKIDGLRETLGNLESQHRLLIEAIKKGADKETSRLLDRIAELRNEAKDLEEKREKLLIPLDDAWKSVKKREISVSILLGEANFDRDKAKILLDSVESKFEKAKDSLGRIKIRERELTKVYTEAETALSEAERIRLDAKSEKERIDKEVEIRIRSVSNLEDTFKNGIASNDSKRILLDERELSLNAKEKVVSDRYETLLRTERRILQ